MDRNALAQARSRLNKAIAYAAAMKANTDINAVMEAWGDFLIAAGAVYSKLEQGAKGHPASEPWFGAKKAQRKADPLLAYLHQARNVEEHGITPPHRWRAPSIVIPPGGHAMVRSDGKRWQLEHASPDVVPNNPEAIL